jgi:phage-related protein (TIGR01555 family)
MGKGRKKAEKASPVELHNSLSSLVASLTSSEEIASPFTLAAAAAYTPLSLNRVTLSYAYMTIGLIQTIIDQPVEDAFRGGIKLEVPELSIDECAALHNEMEEQNDIKAVKEAARWARLFGGGGLLTVTGQNPGTPLSEIEEGDDLSFISADRWELLHGNIVTGTPVALTGTKETPWYSYYGKRVDPSRVLRIHGREAPSFVRGRLQGWGMSEIERCIRSINTFLKLQSVVFELVDEAKIDVFNIEGFNMTLATPSGTDEVSRRIQLAAMLKNYKRALVMDKEDGYAQKQISFGGLAEIFEQARIDLCSDLKMPATKLFGQSAQGFSTGAEDIENYNTVVEGDVRHNVKPLLREVVRLRCQQMYGLNPETVNIGFYPLRVLDGVQEEQVNTSRTNRSLQLFDRDLLTGKEVMDFLKLSGTLTMQTEVGKGLRSAEPEPQEETPNPKEK